MLHPQFRPMLLHHFQHTPTTDQVAAVDALEQFLFAASDDSIFCLRGYAGTGKTSLVAALVRTLQGIGRKVVLLAPTGRAAKVLSSYAGMPAYTIHKMIYRQETFKGEDTRFQMGYNKNRGTLFVVDEASMMGFGGGGNAMFGSGCLMDDFLRHISAVRHPRSYRQLPDRKRSLSEIRPGHRLLLRLPQLQDTRVRIPPSPK